MLYKYVYFMTIGSYLDLKPRIKFGNATGEEKQ